MEIYLCYKELEGTNLKKAWHLFCGYFDNVTITLQDPLDLNVEAVVAPANSFGVMTGGIDLHYRNYLGKQIEYDLQRILAKKYNGELPVGLAQGVKIYSSNPSIKIKYVIFAPTMRVPEVVSHTINSFLAAKAALIEAERLGLNSIAFPGLGTGTGNMGSNDCSKQVAEAIKYVLVDKRHFSSPKNLYVEQEYTRRMAPAKWHELHIV